MHLGDLEVCCGNRRINLFLSDVSIHQAPESVVRSGIPVKGLTVASLRFFESFRSEVQISQLNISGGIAGGHFNCLAYVALRGHELLAIDLSHCAESISVRQCRSQIDDLSGSLLERVHISSPHCQYAQVALRICKIGPQTYRAPPFPLRPLQVSHFLECDA